MSNVNDFEIKNGVLVKYHGGDTEVVIPEGVTGIGASAFSHCSSLKNITISEGVTEIGDYAFNGCKSLSNITIPEGVRKIGGWAFNGCKSLKSITIPESVTEFWFGMFGGCRSLERVVLLGTINPIDDLFPAGGNCLETVIAPKAEVRHSVAYYRGFWEGFDLFDGKKKAEYIKGMHLHLDIAIEALSNRVDNCEHFRPFVESENSAFHIEGNCIIETASNKLVRGFSNSIIPNNVTEIGGSAFWGCDSLIHITIPEGVRKIGNSAFAGCSSLKSITMPESVTSIRDFAFEECKALKNITIPEGVARIGVCAFEGCRSLTNITIPRSVTSIERGAFRMCKSLKNITISKGVRKIGDGAFYGCGSLTNITIPKSVTSIGGDAFGNCKLLESAVVLGDVWLKESIFSNCKSLKAIVAPKKEVCHSAVYYRGFLENIELFDEKKKAAYIEGMFSHQDITVEAVGGDGESFKNFIDRIKPEGELFDLLLKFTTSQGKTELTAILLEYGNSNGNKKSPLDDLAWD